MEALLPNGGSYSIEQLVKYYHQVCPRLKYEEIRLIINNNHNIQLSLSQLKKLLLSFGLNRKSNVSDALLEDILTNELGTSLSLTGYRQMSHNICRKYAVNVSYEKVRKGLLKLDPVGVALRSRNVIRRRVYEAQGPFHVVHIDGHDKLKKWGFAIHGGIDGFSRKVLWLKVSTTNNDPLVVANYFLQCVTRYKMAPKQLRFDRGNENIYCQDIQSFLTKRDYSYRYGSSVRNQRIEALWSRLLRYRIHWWIDFFRTMGLEGIYKGEIVLHQELLLFCFMSVLQYELNEFQTTWNTKRVRKSAEAPGGKPDILFSLPGTAGFTNQGLLVEESDLKVATDVLSIHHPPIYKDGDIHELLKDYCQSNEMVIPPRSAEDGIDLYVKLLQIMDGDGFEV